MNCSFCATAEVAIPASARPSRAALIAFMSVLLRGKPCLSKRNEGSICHNRPLVNNRPCPRATWSRARQLHVYCNAPSMREGPKAQLLLADLPQARQPMRLDHEKEDDEPAKDHQLDVRHQPRRQGKPQRQLDRMGDRVEEDRQQHDEGGAEER